MCPAPAEQGKIYMAQDVDKCLNTAESIAASMKDEYVSVEHLLLALLDTANRELKELFRTYNVQKEGVLQALTNVRGQPACDLRQPGGRPTTP